VLLAVGTSITVNITIKPVTVNDTLRVKTLINPKQEGIKILINSCLGCISY
jgi:DNA polymerase elongation subunit (family B)